MSAPPKSAPRPPPPASHATRPAPAPGKTKSSKGGFWALFPFLADEPVLADMLPDEDGEMRRHQRLLRRLLTQAVTALILGGFLIFTLPFYRPINEYAAVDPGGARLPLTELDMPNLTDRAVLSWATTGVTEILTIGFGDFERKLLAQKPRFTTEGWASFVAAFFNEKIGESFQQNQLVLTTVPSAAAVIIAQGFNKEGSYQWKVQVPVVMTYATNDNVTRHDHAVITLTIVRVSPEQNPSGIAIKSWS